ncbi:MAG: hypothetical protein ACK6CU_13730, partial [Deltaproteobacteria bacterium]
MGQISRAVDRKLLAQLNHHLDRLLPEGARETGRDITVFRTSPKNEVFSARTSLDWVTVRRKKERFQQSATGRGPDAANDAVKGLLAKLADPAQRVGEQAISRPQPTAKVKAEPKPNAAAPARAQAIKRGLVTAARRLLGHLVPGGATNVERSVKVAKRSEASRFFDATGTVKWVTAAGRVGGFTATASADGLDPGNVALAYLLAKLLVPEILRRPVPEILRLLEGRSARDVRDDRDDDGRDGDGWRQRMRGR